MGDLRGLDYNLDRLAINFRVSSFVILRRAYTLDKISTNIFHAKYDELLTKVRLKPADSGGDFYNLLRSRNSPTLTSTLIAGVAEGTVSPPEAARLLNVRIGSLRNIESQILVVMPNYWLDADSFIKVSAEYPPACWGG